VYIRHPYGTESSGQVVEVVAPERIVFTYGFDSGKPIPSGSSRVTVRLEPAGFATRLHLLHEFAEPGVRDEHVQGWRYQLSLFANVVTDVSNAKASDVVDRWFAVWSEADAVARQLQLASIATDDVRFRDRYSVLEGISDLVPHIGAAQRFMPDVHVRRNGDIRHCQGTLLVDWTAASGSGESRGGGTNVFTLRADGKIEAVTGFWLMRV
jgi:uncharacterized protein YndB with AHSA1/START domain